MTTSYDLPLPGDEYDGRTVVASTYCGPIEGVDQFGLVILLNKAKPFYSVAEVNLHTRENEGESSYENINQAVANYFDSGGDI